MPLLFKHTHPVRGVWKLEETVEELAGMLSNKEWYASFLESKATEKRKREWLACRVLLRELAGEELKVDYQANGAPYVSGSSLQISFSHTKDYVAVILSDVPVAIDIEYTNDRIRKIRSKFMNPEEEAALDPLHETTHLLLHWCAKETLFKRIGQKEVDFRKHLHIHPFPYQTSGSFMAGETRTPEQQKFQMEFLVTPDFVLTYSF